MSQERGGCGQELKIQNKKNKYLGPINTKVLKHYWQNYKTNNNGTI